jgi:hypothetical protein
MNTTVRASLAAAAVYAAVGSVPAGASTEPPGTPASQLPTGVPVPATLCLGSISPIDTAEEPLGSIEEFELIRGREATRGAVSSSDPRLEGTFFRTNAGEAYFFGEIGSDNFADVHAETSRIENDEGAWQGSQIEFNMINFDVPDVTGPPLTRELEGPYVMSGEGAYEGLTAVFVENVGNAGPCEVNYTGMIISGDYPEPPALVTGE